MLPARKRNVTLLFVCCAAVICFLLNASDDNQIGNQSQASLTKLSSNQQKDAFINNACRNILIKLSSFGYGGTIIDIDSLVAMSDNKTECSVSSIKVAALNAGGISQLKTNYKNITIILIPCVDNDNTDHWLFTDNGTHRAIPKMTLRNVSKFYYPEDPALFKEYWRRSKHLKCLNFNMNRTNKTQRLPIPDSFEQMASLRDLLVGYGMFPFLVSGSLLGWYRECSIIPHTPDIDFAVFIDQFNPQFEEDVLLEKTQFNMRRTLGMVNDSFEYTVVPTNLGINIDIFFIYKEKENYWFGGTGNDGSKYRFYYPRFDVRCTSDLGGYLFWVPCEPEVLLETEYGTEWRLDHHSSNYSWYQSGQNIREAGQWPEDLLDQVYIYYQKSFWQKIIDW